MKMSILLKLIYGSSAIPIKIPEVYFFKMDKIIPKFIWKVKGTRITERILKKNKVRGRNMLHFKTHCWGRQSYAYSLWNPTLPHKNGLWAWNICVTRDKEPTQPVLGVYLGKLFYPALDCVVLFLALPIPRCHGQKCWTSPPGGWCYDDLSYPLDNWTPPLGIVNGAKCPAPLRLVISTW